MFSKQELIDSLEEVKQQSISGVITKLNYGICGNWSKILDNNVPYNFVSIFSGDWEHSTLDSKYPVPDDESLDLWEGTNLEMRLSLIDHILKRLEESDQDYLDDLCKGY
ncbi:MAG: hypothetical protein RR959_06135 [Erysipelotrichaceae bacterium]